MGHIFCFGLGFTAQCLAREVMRSGWRVSGTCRESQSVETLVNEGIGAFLFDRDHPLPLDALSGVSHVLVSIPPDETGDVVADLYGSVLAGRSDIAWLGYLSTTGVYGDTGGSWVDETSPVNPNVARSARRLKAETCWQVLWRQHGLPVHIFRLAGIYGPGRSAIDAVRAGRARRFVKPGQIFSRVHVEDITTVLRASMARPNPGAIYNVCDDDPAAPQDVVSYACALLQVEPPPVIPYDEASLSLSPMARSFYADSRRVRNDRIKTELGVSLKYPSYREGLDAINQAAGIHRRN